MIIKKPKISSIFLLTIFLLVCFTLVSPIRTQATTTLDPSVRVSDQKIDNNTVYVDQVVCAGPAWIAIHNATDINTPINNQIIGYTHLDHGIHSVVPVSITSPYTSVLVAMLHIDNGTIGDYSPSTDPPVFLNGTIVEMGFNVETDYNPHIVVSSQAIVGSQISIDLIEFNETSGWVAIHNETVNGTIGPTIGHAQLVKGLNFNVLVTIDTKLATDNLYAMIHVDTGTQGVWDYPDFDGAMKRNGGTITEKFGVGGVTVITEGTSGTLNLDSLISSPKILHIIFSIISAFILVLVGSINFIRNPSNRLNQLFLGFYTFIGLFQFFDAFLLLLGTDIDLGFANLLRDIIISSLLLGFAFGVLGVLLIYFGENFILSKRAIIVEIVGMALILLLSLLNDSVSKSTTGSGYGSTGAHIQASRTLLGWITISGFYTLALIVIVYFLVRLIMDPRTGKELRSKLIRLLIGLVLSISFLLLFDLSFDVQEIVDFVLNNYVIHFLAHTIIVIGALFILSAYITTIAEKEKS